MKLEYVLTSCNLNPLYCDFIPIFIRAWKKLIPEIKIVIVLIAESIPEKFIKYSEYIKLFPLLENVPTAFVSQYIRILYPCVLNSVGGVMITDMDMLPMNSKYYTKPVERFDNDKFIYYRGNLSLSNEYAICYISSVSKTWKDIFRIEDKEDIRKRLIEVFNSFEHKEGHGNIGWNKDQLDLFTYVNKWDKKNENFIMLNDKDTGFKRLCRSQHWGIENKRLQLMLKRGNFTDYHALRPYEKYKEINDMVIDFI